MKTLFYCYNQNNSGGSFDYNEATGITHYVIIEATSREDADSRAERIGLYFNGCDDGRDCECCGDRWSNAWGEGDETPKIYGEPAESYCDTWCKKPVCVHPIEGKFYYTGKGRDSTP